MGLDIETGREAGVIKRPLLDKRSKLVKLSIYVLHAGKNRKMYVVFVKQINKD